MIEAEDEYAWAARAVLEEPGFKVYLGAAVEGLSGLTHVFDIVAQKADRIVCVSVKPSSPALLLAEVAKSMDINGEVFIAVLGEAPGMPTSFSSKRLKTMVVESPEDLAEKLKGALA